MYQTGPTIKQTLDDIQSNKIVLPAIQREFVWRPSQICRLFDSLMQGYPFNTFLYWQVEPENSGKFQFYDFVREYHQRDNPRCPRLPSMHDKQLTAVLDGQQRLTALNIGLRGSMAWKLPRLRWTTSHAFPTRKLYLDLLWGADEDDEDGLKYKFNFLTDSQIKAAKTNKEVCWFPVSDSLGMSQAPEMLAWVTKHTSTEYVNQAFSTLFDLFQVVHNKNLIAYYEERSQELDKVLQIFIRTNSGGTMLSYSDLLLSVAVAQWKQRDAREEIHSLVDEINLIGNGFTFSKDLVLKAGLLLGDINNIGFKVDNFGQSNMAEVESNWDDIKNALLLTVELVANFGFNGQNLTSHNAILPIAYYLHARKPGDGYLTSSLFKDDRNAVRKWLIRSLLTGVWGRSTDTVMTTLRQVINERKGDDFPFEQMVQQGPSAVLGEEEIEDLADMQYGNRLTFALLSLMFPHVDLTNHFHVDHIFPTARFTRGCLGKSGVPDDNIDDFIQNRNGLANLQLLQGTLNLEKSVKLPAEWLAEVYYDDTSGRRAYQDLHLLGEVPESITKFGSFYEARRERLKARITELLGRRPASDEMTE